MMRAARLHRLFCTALLASAAACSAPPLVGGWDADAGDGVRTSYVFAADGTGWMRSAGRTQAFTYTVDYERDPVSLDLRMETETGSIETHGIVRFVDDRHARIRLAPAGGPRPGEFSRRDPGVALTRWPGR